ncbi:glycosyl transferase [Flavobacterium sp. L1I52]|uniref:Glycosyl transferase n=1 Tax=Flavobacterium pokkalii TaxID=1940408 RepID=A0ABR7UU70_9FLAO|nr:glycosyltransferase [Flavobacterium pokkalii]MBD0726452.1 glycosyl transferase [Flavobacterium pokkalii]
MKLIVFSSAPVINLNGELFLYAPYECEMQIWAKYVDEIQFCAPVWNEDKKLLINPISFSVKKVVPLYEFNIKNRRETFVSITKVLKNTQIIWQAMQQADHIHLRCPGNIGLLACVMQLFFPSKPKTAKYAGNWDPQSKQPLTYRLQKWILSNPFLTRNMQVLVYGNWEQQSPNIKAFFTASYSGKEPLAIVKTINSTTKIKLLFIGTLTAGKQPLYAVQLLQALQKRGFDVQLDVYGEGPLRTSLEQYMEINALKNQLVLHGNQNQEILKKAYQNSHFVILASKSEGWPKAIAEGMFWGCVPLATAVSCVPEMLDYDRRGILLQMDTGKDSDTIATLINNPDQFEKRSKEAIDWSRKYTLEYFETEIKKLLQE